MIYPEENRQERYERREKEDWQWILSDRRGRRAVCTLLQACQVRRHCFVPGDAYATAFQCGQQSIGQFLLDKIEAARPAALAEMKEEYLTELKEEENQLKEKEDE